MGPIAWAWAAPKPGGCRGGGAATLAFRGQFYASWGQCAALGHLSMLWGGPLTGSSGGQTVGLRNEREMGPKWSGAASLIISIERRIGQ